VWTIVSSLSAGHVAVLAGLTVWNIVTYWPMLVIAMPGLRLSQAAVVNQSSTSVAMTVPGGGALAVGVSYGMYSSWGFTASQVALSALVTGIWNTFVKLGMPVVAVGLLAIRNEDSTGLVSAAVVGVSLLAAATVILLLALRTERVARAVGNAAAAVANRARRLFRKPPVTGWSDRAATFREQILGLVRRRWAALTGAELVSQLSVFLVLLASVRFVGIGEPRVSWTHVLAVFALVRLASTFPIIPGNIGLAELGYAAGLIVAGAPRPEAVAAVLVFRALTYYVQIPIGGVTYLIWRNKHGWRRPQPRASAETGVAEPVPSSR